MEKTKIHTDIHRQGFTSLNFHNMRALSLEKRRNKNVSGPATEYKFMLSQSTKGKERMLRIAEMSEGWGVNHGDNSRRQQNAFMVCKGDYFEPVILFQAVLLSIFLLQ